MDKAALRRYCMAYRSLGFKGYHSVSNSCRHVQQRYFPLIGCEMDLWTSRQWSFPRFLQNVAQKLLTEIFCPTPSKQISAAATFDIFS